jgi:uncharacterized protein YidB (DUF937 family)
MLNPFFLQGSQSEQNLVQDLINEQLRMYGVEVYYMPRKYVTTNTVIREVIESEFSSSFPIEAYVDSYEGYGGQGTLLSKFGIQNYDDLKIIISKDRYESYIAPLSKSIPNSVLTSRPKEGDLIYFPLGDRIFEIKYVEHEQPFYQLQKNYVYTLTCSLFRIEDEVIDTSVDEIDDNTQDQGYIQTLQLIGAGVTATVTAGICTTGGITDVIIKNMGNNYNHEPIVGFSSAPSGGTIVAGISSITNDYINCTGVAGGKVQAVYMSNSGCGYTVAPWVSFTNVVNKSGSGAAATTGIGTGTIQSISIASSGSGYTSNPSIVFPEPIGGGTSATGIGYINSAGNLSSAYLIHAGTGYTTGDLPISVTIETPAGIGSTVGVGTYIFNEIVIGSTSGTTARVNSWISSTNELEIKIVDGEFTSGETVYGTESGALYAMRLQEKNDLVTPFADNDNIETEGDNIIDFTEKNPFGMP